MRWEYKLCSRIDLDRGHIHEMNELGKEGWEAFYAGDTSIYLKRPLQEEEKVEDKGVVDCWPVKCKFTDCNNNAIEGRMVCSSCLNETILSTLHPKNKKTTEQSRHHCNPSCHYWGYQCNINEMFKDCDKKKLDIENSFNKADEKGD